MVAGFSVLSLALDAQTDIVTTQRVISDIELKKQQERFGVAVSTDVDDRLNVAVSNLGQNPVGISSFWIINKTLADQPATRYEIDYDDSFVTGGATTQILTSQTLYMTPDTYDIKVVSELGTIEIAELDVSAGGSSSSALRAVLVTDPPDVILGQNVTLAMIVTNTGQLEVNDVTPSTPSITTGKISTPLPADPSPVDLIPGESVFFLWDYRTDDTANVDTEIVFSTFATGLDIYNNAVQSNVVIDTSVIREDAVDDSSSEPPIVLTQDLLSRPEIFMTIPSPMGGGGDRALWGTNIVNPTAQNMYVNKVVISILSPRANNNDIMFSSSPGGANCDPVTVPPTPDSWSCNDHNQLTWENLSSPILIPPYSVYPFNALVHPDKLAGSSDELSSIIVHSNVYTTVGQFGKAGYGSSFDEGGTALAGVYLSDVVDSTSVNDMHSNRTGILSGSTNTFNVVLSDLDTSSSFIDQNSRLIINVPKGWVVDEPSITGFSSFTTSYELFGDSSSQIIGVLSANLNNAGKTIQFDATAPVVSDDQMYIMYLLADGSTDNLDFTIGPLQEVVLQVVPP